MTSGEVSDGKILHLKWGLSSSCVGKKKKKLNKLVQCVINVYDIKYLLK